MGCVLSSFNLSFLRSLLGGGAVLRLRVPAAAGESLNQKIPGRAAGLHQVEHLQASFVAGRMARPCWLDVNCARAERVRTLAASMPRIRTGVVLKRGKENECSFRRSRFPAWMLL